MSSGGAYISFSQFYDIYNSEMLEVRNQLKEIIKSIAMVNTRLKSLEEEMKRVVTKNGFKSLETKTEAFSEKTVLVEEKLESKIESLEDKITFLDNKLNYIDEDLKERIDSVRERTDYLEEKIEKRVEKIEEKLDELRSNLDMIFFIPSLIKKILKFLISLFRKKGV